MKQGTQEWHDLRRTKIGASDASVIMGVSPWSTPYKLWKEKMGLLPQREMNHAMKRGIQMEEEARKTFESMTGLCVSPEVLVSDSESFMMASLDGIDDEKKNAVEIKCPGKIDHAQAMSGQVPEKYFPQLQHQMFVAELEQIYYFSFDGKDGKILQVTRSDKYIDQMIKSEREFYQCMVDMTPPYLMDVDYVKTEDKEWLETASLYWNARQQASILKKEEERLKEKLINMSLNIPTIGGRFKLSKTVRKGNVNYKMIPELISMDLDKYRGENIEVWNIGEINGD